MTCFFNPVMWHPGILVVRGPGTRTKARPYVCDIPEDSFSQTVSQVLLFHMDVCVLFSIQTQKGSNMKMIIK